MKNSAPLFYLRGAATDLRGKDSTKLKYVNIARVGSVSALLPSRQEGLHKCRN